MKFVGIRLEDELVEKIDNEGLNRTEVIKKALNKYFIDLTEIKQDFTENETVKQDVKQELKQLKEDNSKLTEENQYLKNRLAEMIRTYEHLSLLLNSQQRQLEGGQRPWWRRLWGK